MTLRAALDRLLGGHGTGDDANVRVYCPLQDEQTEETRIASEGTEPDAWVQEDRIAVYECPVCGRRHRFLWGPPAPLYLGDSTGEDRDLDDENGDGGGVTGRDPGVTA